MRRIAVALVLAGLLGLVSALLVKARRSGGTRANHDDETARVADHYEQFSASYDPSMRIFDRLFFEAGRRWVCSRAAGDVLEIAIGTGRNLPYYRDGMRLTGIDISPAMLAIAQQRASELGVEANLRAGDAQALDFPDGSFDTVVCTLSLCTIPDERQAIREAKRVLRPGGRFLLFEHVRSPNPAVRWIQRLLDPIMVRYAADHLLREPGATLQAEGLTIDRLERGRLGIIARIAAVTPAERTR